MPGGGLTAPKKLSAELADIVGKKQASRAELMKLLWAYIKKNNLQVTWPLFQYIFCLRGQNRSRISPILADFTSLSISCPIPGIFIQFPGFHFYSDQVLTSTDSTLPFQDPDNKQYFIPDKKMAKVFGSEKMRGFGMAKSIGPHLS